MGRKLACGEKKLIQDDQKWGVVRMHFAETFCKSSPLIMNK